MPHISFPAYPSNSKTYRSRQFDTETAPRVMLIINNCVLTYYFQWQYCDMLANKHVHAASGSRCVMMWSKIVRYSIVIHMIWYYMIYMIWHDMIYDIIWYDMTWYMILYDMTWHDMIWYDMTWYDIYDTIWYDMIWYMIWHDIWYDMTWYIWYDIWYMTWYDIWYDDMIYFIWYDMWYDMIYDMIWYDMIWYDMIRYDIYLLTAIGLTPGGCSTVHIYTQTIHRTQWNTIPRTESA